jgi:hypothetical protein
MPTANPPAANPPSALPPGAVLPGQLTPSSPSPASSPVPAAGAPGGRTSVTVPAPGVTLQPGTNTFQYTGQPTTLGALLAQAGGKVVAVAFRNPGGYWIIYQAGNPGSASSTVMTGADFSVVATAEVRLSW